MTCGVYEIKNLETNQAYIGRSINIENRWKGHLSAPSNNMAPTVELYGKSPEMVELNILIKIDEQKFDKEELKFITSVCELYELNQRGGWESEDLINGRDGEILACPPTILSKRELLPNCIDIEDILYGIEKWVCDVYRIYAEPYSPRFLLNDKTKNDENGAIYWRRECLRIKDEYKALSIAHNKLKKDKPSFFDQQKAHSLEYRTKMEVDYRYFQLEKSNNILNDQVDELKELSNFWKTKCLKWRAKYHELLEKRCRNKEGD